MEDNIRIALLDPDILFSLDLMENPSLAPQLADPHRIPTIEVYAKGTFPDREPDIRTPRTDVYIVAWEDKDVNDPFYREWPEES
jgi:hypothetical protein